MPPLRAVIYGRQSRAPNKKESLEQVSGLAAVTDTVPPEPQVQFFPPHANDRWWRSNGKGDPGMPVTETPALRALRLRGKEDLVFSTCNIRCWPIFDSITTFSEVSSFERR